MSQFIISPYHQAYWNSKEDHVPNSNWHCSVCDRGNNKEVYAVKWDIIQPDSTPYTVQDYVCSPLCAEMFIFQKA